MNSIDINKTSEYIKLHMPSLLKEDLVKIVQYSCIPFSEYESNKSWYGYFKNIERLIIWKAKNC